MGGFAEAVERMGFAVPLAGLAEEGEGLVELLGGLFRPAKAGVKSAEAVQRPRFAVSVADLSAQRQALHAPKIGR
jgi:hypothetical protein